MTKQKLAKARKRVVSANPVIKTPLPATPPPSVDASASLTVTGTASNTVDGSLMDESSGFIYLPGAGQGTLTAGGWTLTFTTSGTTVESGDLLFVYVYDTITGNPAQANYQQKKAGSNGLRKSPKATRQTALTFLPIIEVIEHVAANVSESQIPERLQDIPVKVTHADNTRGSVLLILRKNATNGTAAETIVKNHRFDPSTQTTCTFRGIKRDQWDLICVAAVAEGLSPDTPIQPVVLKQP